MWSLHLFCDIMNLYTLWLFQLFTLATSGSSGRFVRYYRTPACEFTVVLFSHALTALSHWNGLTPFAEISMIYQVAYSCIGINENRLVWTYKIWRPVSTLKPYKIPLEPSTTVFRESVLQHKIYMDILLSSRELRKNSLDHFLKTCLLM